MASRIDLTIEGTTSARLSLIFSLLSRTYRMPPCTTRCGCPTGLAMQMPVLPPIVGGEERSTKLPLMLSAARDSQEVQCM